VYVLHEKIKAGPEAVSHKVTTDKKGGALEAAGALVEHRESLTDAKERH
jgi:hypothetical protein